jgi:hypothetical protein
MIFKMERKGSACRRLSLYQTRNHPAGFSSNLSWHKIECVLPMDHISKGSDSWVGFCLNAETVREQKNFVKKFFFIPLPKERKESHMQGKMGCKPM